MSDAEYSRIPTVDPEASDKDNMASNCQAGDSRDIPMVGSESSAMTCREWVGMVFVKGNRFQSFVALVILANAAIIGLETDVPERGALWDKFENTFLVIFTFELLLRLYFLRCEFFCNTDKFANIFDFVLVFAGIFEFIVTNIIHGDLGELAVGIKMCRLLRILRLFRLFKMFKQLYMLASGFVDSSVAVFWVSVLCALCLYVCAVFLTRTLGQGESEQKQDTAFYKEKFGTVPMSMFTLFELMADPGNLGEMKKLMFAQPAMLFFFITFIIFGSFAMLSILTGVISEGMIEKGNSHKEEMRFQEEQKKQAFILTLKNFFKESDVDGDGTMTHQEFMANVPAMITLFEDNGFFYDESDLEMVFSLVDFDQGGTVESEEFLQGMASFIANVQDTPLQVLRLQANVFTHVDALGKRLEERVGNFDARFIHMEDRLQSVDEKIARIAALQSRR